MNPDDTLRYEQWQQAQEQRWEAMCRQCGACCGVTENDPCTHLCKTDDGFYQCSIYHDRFGLRSSIHGRQFLCVPLRTILNASWPGKRQCGYIRNFYTEWQ